QNRIPLSLQVSDETTLDDPQESINRLSNLELIGFEESQQIIHTTAISYENPENPANNAVLIQIEDYQTNDILEDFEINLTFEESLHDFQPMLLPGFLSKSSCFKNFDTNLYIHRIEIPPNQGLKINIAINDSLGSLCVYMSRNPDNILQRKEEDKRCKKLTFGENLFIEINEDKIELKNIYIGVLRNCSDDYESDLIYQIDFKNILCDQRVGNNIELTVPICQTDDITFKCSCSKPGLIKSLITFYGVPVSTKDLINLKNLEDNIPFLIFLACLFLLYGILLCLINSYQSKKNLKIYEVQAIPKVLNVNKDPDLAVQEEPHGYTAIFYTSSLPSSSCIGNIQVTLVPIDHSMSPIELHFANNSFNLFKTGTTVPLFFKSYNLDEIEKVSVKIFAHNNDSNCYWRLDRVLITNLFTHESQIFASESSIGVTTNKINMDSDLYPSKGLNCINKFFNVPLEEVREEHALIGILLHHKFSIYTRSQRLTVFYMLFLANMLVSIMYYNLSLNIPQYQDNSSTFSFSEIIKSVAIGIKSSLVIAAISIIPIKIFKQTSDAKSRKIYNSSNKLPKVDKSCQIGFDDITEDFIFDFSKENSFQISDETQSILVNNSLRHCVVFCLDLLLYCNYYLQYFSRYLWLQNEQIRHSKMDDICQYWLSTECYFYRTNKGLRHIYYLSQYFQLSRL
ncbi:MAG: detection of nodal flow, variant 2, partial [Marteilia pararefringens]